MKIEQAVEKAKKRIAERGGGSDVETVRNLRTAPAAQENWNPPVYAQSQPRVLDARKLSANRCVCFRDDAAEMDYYKMLRTQIVQQAQAKGWNTFMVTSTRPGEGKTLTSINLAMTFARTFNHTVLLMDCDLRQQKIFRYLGIEGSKGIADHLAGEVPLKEIIVWPGIDKMSLISGGRTFNESAELLGSPRMKSLIQEMKARYPDRYILIDAPPVLSGPDALLLSTLADGIVMVVESGKTALKEIEEALALMPAEKFLGFVLNRHRAENKGYYNYYSSARQR